MSSTHWLWLALVLLVAGAIFFAGYHFRKSRAWEETVQSLNVEIEQLETQVRESKKAAEDKLVEAKEPEAKADDLEPIIQKGREDLARARRAQVKAEDEVVMLRGQNALLEEALRLRNDELSAKAAAIGFFQLALSQSEERGELMDEKVTALKRSKRAERRKRIGILIASHAATAGIFYGIGRVN